MLHALSKWFAGNPVIAELPGRTVVQANNRNGTSVPLVNFLQPRTIGMSVAKGDMGWQKWLPYAPKTFRNDASIWPPQ
jgi:hypothetical protein